jgi:hypothetical protein
VIIHSPATHNFTTYFNTSTTKAIQEARVAMVYKNWHACGAASSMDLYHHGDIMIDDQLLQTMNNSWSKDKASKKELARN